MGGNFLGSRELNTHTQKKGNNIYKYLVIIMPSTEVYIKKKQYGRQQVNIMQHIFNQLNK